MERVAVAKARQLHQRHPGLSYPIDMEQVAFDEGCEVIIWPFSWPVKEVKHGRWIGVAANLEPSEQRYLVAHALGHHFLHCGNQLSFYEWDRTITWKQERKADDCAAHILMPEEVLKKLRYESTRDIAEYFGVPEPLVVLRLTEFATDRERSCRP